MKKVKKKYLSRRIRAFFLLIFLMLLLLSVMLTLLFIFKGVSFLWALMLYIISIAMAVIFRFWIVLPFGKFEHLMELVADGYSFDNLQECEYSISPEMEHAMQQLRRMIDQKEILRASKKQAEYLALQNQINPHFLYNTLEGIRGETLAVGLDSVANMTESLATFFRYTISKGDRLVTLAEELKNVRDYYTIQRYRFGERLSLQIEYDKSEERQLMDFLMPKLTLQPLVENAVYHGIERKLGTGHIWIKIEMTRKRLLIVVSDDGLGIESEQLEEMNQRLQRMKVENVEQRVEQKGGIAISNVSNRIKLLFGESYGLHMYSVINGGTDVEITLPLVREDRTIEGRDFTV